MKRVVYKGTPYQGDWTCAADILRDFNEDISILEGSKVLYAWYEIDGYEGSCYVIFKRDGKLYDVSGSHCSCYGLEGQWDPEETSIAAIYQYKPEIAVLLFGPAK